MPSGFWCARPSRDNNRPPRGRTGQRQDALAAYEEALHRQPDFREAHCHVAQRMGNSKLLESEARLSKQGLSADLCLVLVMA